MSNQEKCQSCNGSGEVRHEAKRSYGSETWFTACPDCHGTGINRDAPKNVAPKQESEKEFPCIDCDETFDTRHESRQHFLETHYAPSPSTEPSQDSEWRKCPGCLKVRITKADDVCASCSNKGRTAITEPSDDNHLLGASIKKPNVQSQAFEDVLDHWLTPLKNGKTSVTVAKTWLNAAHNSEVAKAVVEALEELLHPWSDSDTVDLIPRAAITSAIAKHKEPKA